jgi:translocation and assembly module TamA
MMSSKPQIFCVLALGVSLAIPLHADKVKVEVKVNGDSLLRELRNRELKDNILSSLSLEKENDGKLTPERIRKLYAQAPDEIGAALQPYGYFKPQVRPELSQTGTTWTATFDVEAGPPITIASVDLRITGAGADDPGFQNVASHFPVRQGDVFVSPTYEGAKKRLTDVAAANGYLDAAFQENQVRVDLVRYQADVILHYDTGPRYLFGPVYFRQDVLNGSLLTGYIDFTPGEPLDVNKVLRLQTSLAESSYWARVEVVTR